MPSRSSVATLANGKVIAAERALAVMARHTAHTAARCVMVERFRRRDLPSLRQSRSNLVAFVASYFLMFGMIESYAECLGEFRSPRVTIQLVTRAARRDVAATRLRSRRMASITSCVCVKSRGY